MTDPFEPQRFAPYRRAAWFIAALLALVIVAALAFGWVYDGGTGRLP